MIYSATGEELEITQDYGAYVLKRPTRIVHIVLARLLADNSERYFLFRSLKAHGGAKEIQEVLDRTGKGKFSRYGVKWALEQIASRQTS